MEIEGISVVVPFLNEEAVIEEFCSAIDTYQRNISAALELVFVDDGSKDRTLEKIRRYDFRNIHKIKIVKLSKNYGSHAAIRAGLQNVSYHTATWMGSDLQEPLQILQLGMEQMIQGYDAVYFEKKAVKVSAIEKCFSGIYSWLMKKYAVNNFESGGINTIMVNKKILTMMNTNVESNSSIVLQIVNAGYKHTTIPIEYKARSGGKSKWTFSKKIKLFIDSFVAFSFMPIRLVSIVGILIFIFGFFLGIATIVNKFTNPFVSTGYSTIVCVLALGFGITNIALGIIAEYVWRTYDAARKRPAFLISEIEELKQIESSGHDEKNK